MNDSRADRLYELLPVVYRMRDSEQGGPLKALLQVIAEQVNLVEDDIAQLYENWFIETCEDWVVPYLGDLVGYEPVHEAGEPSPGITPHGRQRNKILIPRREVANTVRYRRRKGTLALLELLSNDVAGWPARAVEFYKLLAWTQSINHLHRERAQTVDIRKGSALDLLDSPFDTFAHTVDVRRINAHPMHVSTHLLPVEELPVNARHPQGRHNIPSVGVFIWRLNAYSVTRTPAYCLEAAGPHCFTFSVLGNNGPLFIHPEAETDPTHIAEELNLPIPIRRRLFEENLAQLYGDEKSFQIWVGKKRGKKIEAEPVRLHQIVPADLSDWQYAPCTGKVAVDPVLGRIAFPTRQLPKNGVWVSYHYGFSMDLGGGEYERSIAQPEKAMIYRVAKGVQIESIKEALEQWEEDDPEHAVIEINDSSVYVEQIHIEFKGKQKSLQLRAGNRRRPIIRLVDWLTDQPDSIVVNGNSGNRFVLDGLLISGRGVQIGGDLAELTVRHSTLVPGWTLDCDCEPQRCAESSLEIFSPDVCVKIDHSIVGSIQINPYIPEFDSNDNDEELDSATMSEITQARCQGIGKGIRLDPIRICINDSIVDATGVELEALGAPGCPVAHACVNIRRSTVIGQIQVHAIELGENSLFLGRITVARRQKGCLRFCYITPESRTPKRYRCQPDLVLAPIEEAFRSGTINETEKNTLAAQESKRVRPLFNSLRYGTPTYCQLSDCCADEIKRGADDESEMGVFHDLYQPQRLANLRVRLDEYLPARMDVGISVSN